MIDLHSLTPAELAALTAAAKALAGAKAPTKKTPTKKNPAPKSTFREMKPVPVRTPPRGGPDPLGDARALATTEARRRARLAAARYAPATLESARYTEHHFQGIYPTTIRV